MTTMDFIRIKGASQHNLKNVNLDIPRDKLVVITGVSGSGKSSLAFDTIYAEGQRRYVESLSTYARQFIGQMDKPEVESIEGLSPAIAIEQRAASHNPRSTVGTVTEIYDYFRLLFAGIGVCHCYNCGREIKSQTIDSIVQSVLALPENTRFSVLAPLTRGKKGEFAKELKKLQKEGFARVRIDGEIRDLAEDIILSKTKRHDIDLVVDRLVLKEGIRKRLRDSVEIAADKSDGLVRIVTADGVKRCTLKNTPVPIAASAWPRWRPACFPSTVPTAPARSATVWVRACISRSTWSCRTRACRFAKAPSRPGPDGTPFTTITFWMPCPRITNSTSIRRLTSCPKKSRMFSFTDRERKRLNSIHDRPDKRYFAHRPFEGAIKQLERRWRETTSTAVRNDLARYIDLRAL